MKATVVKTKMTIKEDNQTDPNQKYRLTEKAQEQMGDKNKG